MILNSRVLTYGYITLKAAILSLKMELSVKILLYMIQKKLFLKETISSFFIFVVVFGFSLLREYVSRLTPHA